MPKILSWWRGGILLGLVFLLAVLFVKPIGVSTQFVVFNAALWDMIDPGVIVADEAASSGYSSPNAYLNKGGGKIAKEAANLLSYDFLFVVAMIFGAFLSARLKGDSPEGDERQMPQVWSARFGGKPVNRYIAVFIAGFIVLFGARLAGGCTSGQMMSGMMQTALSGYLFALGAFATAIPLAIFLYKKS